MAISDVRFNLLLKKMYLSYVWSCHNAERLVKIIFINIIVQNCINFALKNNDYLMKYALLEYNIIVLYYKK